MKTKVRRFIVGLGVGIGIAGTGYCPHLEFEGYSEGCQMAMNGAIASVLVGGLVGGAGVGLGFL